MGAHLSIKFILDRAIESVQMNAPSEQGTSAESHATVVKALTSALWAVRAFNWLKQTSAAPGNSAPRWWANVLEEWISLPSLNMDDSSQRLLAAIVPALTDSANPSSSLQPQDLHTVEGECLRIAQAAARRDDQRALPTFDPSVGDHSTPDTLHSRFCNAKAVVDSKFETTLAALAPKDDNDWF